MSSTLGPPFNNFCGLFQSCPQDPTIYSESTYGSLVVFCPLPPCQIVALPLRPYTIQQGGFE